MDASDNEKSKELKHEPKDESDLAHCWRDASNSSVDATAGTKKSTNKAVALKRKMVLQPGMNAERLEMPKKPPWVDNIEKPGDDPTSGPISLSESLHGYFLSNASDRPKRTVVDQDCKSLCPLGDQTKTGSLIERRSVLEYVQFGHNPGQHCKLRLTLIYGGKLTSRGYYCDSGRKPDQKQIGELQTHHVSSARVSIGELQTHHVSSTSVSIYARTACRI